MKRSTSGDFHRAPSLGAALSPSKHTTTTRSSSNASSSGSGAANASSGNSSSSSSSSSGSTLDRSASLRGIATITQYKEDMGIYRSLLAHANHLSIGLY